MHKERPAPRDGLFSSLASKAHEFVIHLFPPTTISQCFEYVQVAKKTGRYLPEDLSYWQKVAHVVSQSLQQDATFSETFWYMQHLNTYEQCVVLEVLVDPRFGVKDAGSETWFTNFFQQTLRLYDPESTEREEVEKFVRSSPYFPFALKLQCGHRARR